MRGVLFGLRGQEGLIGTGWPSGEWGLIAEGALKGFRPLVVAGKLVALDLASVDMLNWQRPDQAAGRSNKAGGT
jgi:hypothetical protein